MEVGFTKEFLKICFFLFLSGKFVRIATGGEQNMGLDFA